MQIQALTLNRPFQDDDSKCGFPTCVYPLDNENNYKNRSKSNFNDIWRHNRVCDLLRGWIISRDTRYIYVTMLCIKLLVVILKHIQIGSLRKCTIHIITSIMHVFRRSNITTTVTVLAARDADAHSVIIREARGRSIANTSYTCNMRRFWWAFVWISLFRVANVR